MKSGRFMKILPDYEHMEYRDVYTCRTYLLLVDASCTKHTRDAAWSVTFCFLSRLFWGGSWGCTEGVVSQFFLLLMSGVVQPFGMRRVHSEVFF